MSIMWLLVWNKSSDKVTLES